MIRSVAFGLMLQRRREYVTLLAQGMQAGELRALVLGETAFVAACGLAAGTLVGTGMAYLSVHILRSLFILDPTVTFPGDRGDPRIGTGCRGRVATTQAERDPA